MWAIKEDDSKDGDEADREVNVEAQSPCNFVLKGVSVETRISIDIGLLTVKTPPRRGPATDAIPYIPPINPI